MRAQGPLRSRPAQGEFNSRFMPDFRGLRLPDAMRLVIQIQGRYNIDYSIAGTGRVRAQAPAPGAVLRNGGKILLNFT